MRGRSPRLGPVPVFVGLFRNDLTRNPGNGRSLFGLWQTLLAMKKDSAAAAEKQFDEAWKHADVKLRLLDF